MYIGDFLDRYTPGNVVKISFFLCHRLKSSYFFPMAIFVSVLKLMYDDIPFAIMQTLYLFNSSQISRTGLIILISIIKNILIIIASVKFIVTVRPSYLEQGDFDEVL